MLAISPAASEAIRGLLEASEMPTGSGMRITLSSSGTEGALEISLRPHPEAEDQVVEVEGAAVFIEPQALPLVDDKVLDAHVERDQVAFALLQQGGPTNSTV
ncbi:hypothetical protein [Thermoleophilum album]|uniref:Fe-S cluster assembly iron-binding protein IscA n=1 Tax=Thermoleophilum album TaxID=29539 RepID=A0A1H6G0I7_THEAL|nr:hypothetical protein [Thermoleophilum album]SEH15514.1 Fe-S cluster assembly iron-binding protein IscA [Thermoleophilum album]